MKIFNYLEVEATNRTTVGASKQKGRWLITRETGCEDFELRMFELQPGGRAPLHTHSMDHAVFILDGEGVFIAEGEEREIKSGDVIFVPPHEKHGIMNTGGKTLSLIDILHPDAITHAV